MNHNYIKMLFFLFNTKISMEKKPEWTECPLNVRLARRSRGRGVDGPNGVVVPRSRSRIPSAGRCIMDAMKEGRPEGSMSTGRVVALAAGLSIGAGVGYMVYRHLSSSGVGAACESPASLS